MTPATPAANDASGAELGLRFTPTADGYVNGVRFYKGAGNTGIHTGSLWDAGGTKLASVAFTDETASGWQSARFSAVAPVVAGQTYVVSYTAPAGHYAVESDAFTTDPVDRNRYAGVSPGADAAGSRLKSTVVVSKTAGAICDAMNRCQIS